MKYVGMILAFFCTPLSIAVEPSELVRTQRTIDAVAQTAVGVQRLLQGELSDSKIADAAKKTLCSSVGPAGQLQKQTAQLSRGFLDLRELRGELHVGELDPVRHRVFSLIQTLREMQQFCPGAPGTGEARAWWDWRGPQGDRHLLSVRAAQARELSVLLVNELGEYAQTLLPPSALTPPQLEALTRAVRSGVYSARLMARIDPQTHMRQDILLFGEAHLKNAAQSDLGVEVVQDLPAFGIESAVWMPRETAQQLMRMNSRILGILGCAPASEKDVFNRSVMFRVMERLAQMDQKSRVTVLEQGMALTDEDRADLRELENSIAQANASLEKLQTLEKDGVVGRVAVKHVLQPVLRQVLLRSGSFRQGQKIPGNRFVLERRNAYMTQTAVQTLDARFDLPLLVFLVGDAHVPGVAQLLGEQYGFVPVVLPGVTIESQDVDLTRVMETACD